MFCGLSLSPSMCVLSQPQCVFCLSRRTRRCSNNPNNPNQDLNTAKLVPLANKFMASMVTHAQAVFNVQPPALKTAPAPKGPPVVRRAATGGREFGDTHQTPCSQPPCASSCERLGDRQLEESVSLCEPPTPPSTSRLAACESRAAACATPY